MKISIGLFLLCASSGFAWNPPIQKENKLKHADWVGVGIIEKKEFVKNLDGAYQWKSSLIVSEVLKGDDLKLVEFYFEQGESLNAADMWYVRCPAFPKVTEGQKVRIYLHKDTAGKNSIFLLRRDQMIESQTEPNQALQTTPRDSPSGSRKILDRHA